MVLRRLKIIMLIFVIICSFSCGTGEKEDDEPGNNEKTVTELRLDYHLTHFFLENVISRFNFEHKNMRITGKKYESVAPATQEKRLAELLSGDGPDLIAESQNGRVINNYKAITSGVYHDMSSMFSIDERLKDLCFFEPVFDSGVFDGKLLYIPYSFTAIGFYCTPEILQKYNIEIDDVHWTWEDIAELSDKYGELLNEDGKYLFNFPVESEFIRLAAMSFTDYEEGKARFSSEEGITLMKLFKKLYPSIRPLEMDNGLRKNRHDYLLDERTVFSAGTPVLAATKLANSYGFLLNEGLGLRVFPMPLPGEENKYQFKITNTIGIYGGSEHKEEAFEFISYMLQDEVIGNPNVNMMVGGLPVNKTAYEVLFNKMQEAPKVGARLPDDVVSDSMEILNNLSRTSVWDRQIESIVKKYMEKYLSGEMTAAAAAKAMDENIEMYLSE